MTITLNNINAILPACSLAFLLLAVALISTDLNNVQDMQTSQNSLLTAQTELLNRQAGALNEVHRQSAIHARLLVGLETDSEAQAVRLVRIESELCQSIPKPTHVQCNRL